jgi:hypothetical protein
MRLSGTFAQVAILAGLSVYLVDDFANRHEIDLDCLRPSITSREEMILKSKACMAAKAIAKGIEDFDPSVPPHQVIAGPFSFTG